ncbi:MAG: SRPBCC family protein [Acidimicrobiia bacterium]|nr:SRPBCC family protein [Acidimicrobiia bacterium]
MSDDGPIHSYSETIYIDAPPATVWGLVTAMERYGEWSSENTGGYWRKRENGEPCTGEVGDEFVGINRRDGQEWKALVEIVERDEERAFAFVTGGTALNFVQWGYRLAPEGSGTSLTEHWELRNLSPIMVENGEEEVQRRKANAIESLAKTLAGIKATAEAAPTPSS